MEFQAFGERCVVRLESGEPVMQTLTKFLRDHSIGFANVSAAGAIKSIRLGYWDAGRREYQFRDFDEQLEVVSFQGNATLKDGQPFLHIHAALARPDYSVIGGHVAEATVHPTFEVWLRTEDMAVRREHDRASGLDLLALDSAAEVANAERLRLDASPPDNVTLSS